MNKLKRLYFRMWRPAVLVLSLTLVTYLLYFHRLGSLLPGYSSAELNTYSQASSWHTIAANPVNAPYKVVVWLLAIITHHGIILSRATAACFGVLAVLTFWAIIRPWYPFRVAFLGSLLFATSAGLLHSARLGTGQILQMGVLAFVGAVMWYRRRHDHRVYIGYGVAGLFALLCYIPGMVWFELFGVAILWGGLYRQLRQMPTAHIVGWSATFLGLLLPLVLGSIQSTHLLVVVSGLPPSVSAISHIGSNLLNAVLSIGVRSNADPSQWVGHAPLLVTAELMLGALGAYMYLYRQRSVRAIFLGGSVAISLTLISLGGSVGFATLVPLLYLFIVHGLDYFMEQWATVFPRNPIAKFTGMTVIITLLLFSVLYQVRAYFVAWPHAEATTQTFHELPQP
ncbi:MAG TPA: hypothetical protein VLE99_01865 [Candidatus Saccharimonadales bacterium]|nr:hypothetical protein [Candidatus Saccharimonadales bacterium]